MNREKKFKLIHIKLKSNPHMYAKELYKSIKYSRSSVYYPFLIWLIRLCARRDCREWVEVKVIQMNTNANSG